jgi:hypothetical protein
MHCPRRCRRSRVGALVRGNWLPSVLSKETARAPLGPVFDSCSGFGLWLGLGDSPAHQTAPGSQILTLPGHWVWRMPHRPSPDRPTPSLAGNDLREGKAVMNTYSALTNLLRVTNGAAVQVRKPVLLPRTAADELPPYREQPWIIDGRGYRKIDPSMTLVPAGRL